MVIKSETSEDRSLILKPRNPRRDLMREEILRKAAALFEQRGYRGVSVENIVDEVGISKPTFYAYFESKDEVVWEICKKIGAEVHKHVRAVFSSKEDARKKLHKLIRGHLENLANLREFYAVYFQEEAGLPPELRRKLKATQHYYQRKVEAIIQQGIQEGVFARDTDPKIAALGLLGMCNWMHKWYKPGGALSLGDIADKFFAMLNLR